MLLMDLSQVLIATMMVQLGNHATGDVDENMFRHMAINSIRANKVKFGPEFGELVICVDSKTYWRKDAFPYYKANRKESRKESDLNWPKIFDAIAKVTSELEEFMPYKVVRSTDAEADDIIGTACHKYGAMLGNENPILILSGDKDFVQLQTYSNVKQFSPAQKRWITHTNPDEYLKEHVIRGDRGDGIPNALSADSTFVMKERQKVLSKKRFGMLMERDPEIMTGDVERNIARNQLLIDLSLTPQAIKDDILKQLEAPNEKDRSKILPYFMATRLRHLVEHLSEF